MEVTVLRRMASRLADYVEKRAKVPFCYKDVMKRLSTEEVYFYYKKIFGGKKK